jgi:Transposase DDE domain
MTTKGNSLYNSLIINTLSKISTISKWRQTFLIETFTLFLSIKGRINFLQLERYGKYTEQRYRQQFEKAFDCLSFNKELVMANGSGHYIIAIDPSYISKAGKKTPGIGYFWSGCAGQVKRGLEITGLAAIDIDNHTGFHLEAVQTIIKQGDTRSLAARYADIITRRKDTLLPVSSVVVADAWFAKKSFTDAMLGSGFQFISRLRDDASLKYLHSGGPTGKRGRPKKHGGKVDHQNIDKTIFKQIQTNDGHILYSAIVYSVSLERNIRVVHLKISNGKEKNGYKLYFCTDTKIAAELIFKYYQSRFQIEFLYRDAKQHTGLTDCQARSENKLHFQFNAALSAINIAKVVHWLALPKQQRKAFSMNDIKTMNHNALLIERFFIKFGINPNLPKNQNHIKELIYYGTIAA